MGKTLQHPFISEIGNDTYIELQEVRRNEKRLKEELVFFVKEEFLYLVGDTHKEIMEFIIKDEGTFGDIIITTYINSILFEEGLSSGEVHFFDKEGVINLSELPQIIKELNECFQGKIFLSLRHRPGPRFVLGYSCSM